MLKLKFLDSEKEYGISFQTISNKIVSITGAPVNTSGFMLSRAGMDDNWNYSVYTTVYKKDGDTVLYSRDGSIYVEPVKPESYVPTEEEIAEKEKQDKINSILAEIEDYKNQLEKTDYIIIKMYELSLVGETTDEYNIEELHNSRQEIRDKINELQKEYDELTYIETEESEIITDDVSEITSDIDTEEVNKTTTDFEEQENLEEVGNKEKTDEEITTNSNNEEKEGNS